MPLSILDLFLYVLGTSGFNCQKKVPSYPCVAYSWVHSVVLVFTMFALRLVPRGVPKKGVIGKKRGIPRYLPHK